MQKKNLIITGGSGYIGSILAERLKTSYSVYVIDKKKNKFLKKINYIKLDLSKKKQLLKLNNLNIDIVVHLAAQSTVDLVKKK